MERKKQRKKCTNHSFSVDQWQSQKIFFWVAKVGRVGHDIEVAKSRYLI